MVSAPSGELTSLKKKVEFTGKDILPMKEELDALQSQKAFSLIGFILLLLGPALLCATVKAAFLLTEKSDDPAILMAERAEKALKDACSIGDAKAEFLSCLYKALVSAIYARAGIKGESLTYAEAKKILCANGCSKKTATQAATLLEKIESAQYGGLGMDKEVREELLAETKQLVGDIGL